MLQKATTFNEIINMEIINYYDVFFRIKNKFPMFYGLEII